MTTLQHEAHGSDVEEEKRRRVVNKNFKAMRMANAETKKSMPNMAKYAKYAYLGTYLGAQNMVKWGIPEKILQNAVHTRWSCTWKLSDFQQKYDLLASNPTQIL